MRSLMALLFTLLFSASITFAEDISFEWDSNTESDIAGYRLYQSNESGVYTFGENSPDKVADVPHVAGPTQSATILNVQPGTWYWVATAYDDEGSESDKSNEVVSLVGPPDAEPPTVPTNLVTNTTSEPIQIGLSWTASTDNIGVANYIIYRTGVEIATSDTTSYSDTNVIINTEYCYTVVARDTSGNVSAASNEACATVVDVTPPGAPTQFQADVVVLPDFTIQGLPLNLQGSAPESGDVTLTLNNLPPGTSEIRLIITVFDPDFADEGRMFINGQSPVTLFGAEGTGSNDATIVVLSPISTDSSLYHIGDNTITFWHDNTAGYRIEDITIEFN